MASAKSRTIAKRRDRRKAKASDFEREGKSNNSKIGHGSGSFMVSKKQTNEKTNPKHIENENAKVIRDRPGTFGKIGDLLK